MVFACEKINVDDFVTRIFEQDWEECYHAEITNKIYQQSRWGLEREIWKVNHSIYEEVVLEQENLDSSTVSIP